MNDLLKSELKRPMDPSVRGNDVAALRNLVGFMNDPAISGAKLPPPEEQEQAAPAAVVAMPTPPPFTAPVNPVSRRVFFTGRLGVGKDYVAEQIGAPTFGFADPLYYLATYFFGVEVTSTKNKDLPGMRAFLQQIGQWGRADVDEQYPYTPARAAFCLMVRLIHENFDKRLEVDWKQFGLDPLIWVTSMLSRCNEYLAENPTSRVATTNVRFSHEYKALSETWEGWHVMCSPETWAKRLASKKIQPNAPVLSDKSEHMAIHLDEQVRKQISMDRTGRTLRVIWNDPDVAPPSPRLLTLSQFCERVAATDNVIVHTGE
jgi:hypothetical protein